MEAKVFVTKEPVTVGGYGDIFRPGMDGFYRIKTCFTDQKLIRELEKDRRRCIEWCVSQLKNPRKGFCCSDPWELRDDPYGSGKYPVIFAWDKERLPAVVDSKKNPVRDLSFGVLGGSKLCLSFLQKPYVQKKGWGLQPYGTELDLLAIQLVEVVHRFTRKDVAAEAAQMFEEREGFEV